MAGKLQHQDLINKNRKTEQRKPTSQQEKVQDFTLHAQTLLLEKIAITSPDVFFILDPLLEEVKILHSGQEAPLPFQAKQKAHFPESFLKSMQEDDRQQFLEKLRNFEKNDPNRDEFGETEISFRADNSTLLHFNIRYTPYIIRGKKTVESWFCQASDITGSKKQLEELESRNLALQMALDGAKMGTWSYDPSNQKIKCDTRTCNIFGLEQDEQLVDIDEFFLKIHPEDRDSAIFTALNTLNRKKRFNHEFRITPSGTAIAKTVAIIGEFIKDEQAETAKITGVCMDISHYKIAGNRIETNEAFLEESQRIANIGCFDWDLAIDKISLTRQSYKILEVGNNDKFSFQYFLDNTHPNDRETFDIAVKDTIKEGTDLNQELVYVTKNGVQKVLWVRGQASRNSKKRTSRIIGTVQDITEKKEKEKKLKTQNLIIRSILDNLPVIILIVDKTGTVKTQLGSGLKRIGLSENEAVGENIFEQYPAIANHIHKALNGETVHFTEELEVKGEQLHFLSYYFYDNEREVAVGFSIDVTAQKKAEAAFLQVSAKNQELERMNQVMDMFVYAVAHDLKNPINNLEMLASLLVDSVNEEEEEEYLEALKKSVFRLKQTINGLTEIIQIESSRELHSRKLKFRNILEHVMADLRPLLKQKEGILKVQFQETDINYNEAFLISIFKNLLSNAIKYATINNPLRIFISTQREGDTILLKVSDNGIGINLDQFGPKLFKPFKRFTRQAEGTGVGLHLIKSIVERNGGSIKIESTPGHGSTFICYLKPYS